MHRSFSPLLSLGLLFTLAVPFVAQTPADDTLRQRVFLIGNSLTWDTVPSKLDGDIQWHVDCGKNLVYILQHPEQPCVKTSTLWPTALKEKQYDVVCVQPHYGTTVEEDADAISQWMKLQPNAMFVIHTGWARSAALRQEYASDDAGGQLQHSPAYFGKLLSTLRRRHPSRRFGITPATRLLNEIAEDIDAGRAPLDSIEDLYRDAIHMTTSAGRYLMHNVMRTAIDQPLSSVGFETVPEQLRSYLDSKLRPI